MAAKRWHTSEDKIRGLLFPGTPKLLEFINKLVRRARRYGTDNPPPLLYLVSDDVRAGKPSPLDGVEDRLEQSKGIPHARIDGSVSADETDEIGSVQRLLHGTVAGIAGKFGRAHRIRFPHYGLAVWLVGLRSGELRRTEPDQRDRVMAEQLRSFVRRGRTSANPPEGIPEIVADLPWWIRLFASQAPRISLTLARLNFRAPRWFARHTVGRGRGRRFVPLAWDFVEGDPGLVDPEVICSLLVDAFLEDLRQAYRRDTVLGLGRRRTAHAVLLIDGADGGSPGLRLMEMIERSRNVPIRRGDRLVKRYRWDPLLVIATGDAAGRDASGIPTASGVLHEPADSLYAYREWRDELEQAGRGRSWFLPLKLPPSESPHPGIRDRLITVPLPSAPRTIVAPLLLAVVLLLGGVAAVDRRDHCWAWPGEPLLERHVLSQGRHQCVGLSSGRYEFFRNLSTVNYIDGNLKSELAAAEGRINRNSKGLEGNERAVTVVFLGPLTPTGKQGFRSVLEELRGVAVAQEDNMSDVPIRVLLANAGDGMKHGRLAAEAIARAAASDPSIVGVIGMGLSHEGTRQAIRRLADARMPMVGTAISATDLATKTSEYYYQVGPTNRREARMAAHYASEVLKVRRVAIYYAADNEDIYSQDLGRQVGEMFAERGIEVHAESYREAGLETGTDLGILAQRACDLGRDGLVFYAGRAERFLELLNGFRNSCEIFPQVLAGDDVTRFVLGDDLRNLPGVRFDYLSFASSLAWGADCGNAVESIAFYARYTNTFGSTACTDTRDGLAMLAHDALLTVATAVRRARADGPNIPSSDRVLGEIGSISDLRQGAVNGASGRIDFGSSGRDRVPLNKAILVLRVEGRDGVPRRMLLCGKIDAIPPADSTCPDDRTTG